jgi:hypothetical protein
MSDHQLSTSDLAARTDDEDSPETEQPTGDATSASVETTGADTSLTRDPTTEDVGANGPADTETEPTGNTGGYETHDAGTDRHESLFPTDQRERFTDRWQEIQTSFVDQPREAVAEADSLVADLMQRLAASFSQERERLEAQWDRGDHVSTEDLRVALTRYRSFFDRLLSA